MRGYRTCSPLSLSDVRTPLLPVLGPVTILLETLLLLGQIFEMVDADHGKGGDESARGAAVAEA